MTSETMERVYRHALRHHWRYGRQAPVWAIARAVGLTVEETEDARVVLRASGLLGDRRLEMHNTSAWYAPTVIGVAWVTGEERWVTPL